MLERNVEVIIFDSEEAALYHNSINTELYSFVMFQKKTGLICRFSPTLNDIFNQAGYLIEEVSSWNWV